MSGTIGANENNSGSNKMCELESQVQTQTSTIRTLSTMLEQGREVSAKLKVQRVQDKATIDGLEQEMHRLRVHVEGLNHELMLRQRETVKEQSEQAVPNGQDDGIMSVSDASGRFAAKLSDCERRIKYLEGVNDKLLSENESAKSAERIAMESVSSLRAKVKSMTAERSALQAAHKAQKEVTQKTEDALYEVEQLRLSDQRTIADLRDRCDSSGKEISRLISDSDRLITQIREIIEDRDITVAKLQTEVTEANATLKEKSDLLEKDLLNKKSILVEKELNISRLEGLVKKYKEVGSLEVRDATARFTSQIESLEASHALEKDMLERNCEQRIREAEDAVRKQFRHLEVEISRVEDINAGLAQEVQSERRSRETATAELKENLIEMTQLRNRCIELEGSVSKATETLSEYAVKEQQWARVSSQGEMVSVEVGEDTVGGNVPRILVTRESQWTSGPCPSREVQTTVAIPSRFKRPVRSNEAQTDPSIHDLIERDLTIALQCTACKLGESRWVLSCGHMICRECFDKNKASDALLRGFPCVKCDDGILVTSVCSNRVLRSAADAILSNSKMVQY